MQNNGIMNSWIQEAEKEFLAKGWKEASQNAVLLTVFGMICQQLDKRFNALKAPLWTMALSAASAVVWMVIRNVLGVV